MFAMHLVHGMYPDQFKENEWEAFTGMLVADVKDAGKQSLPQWVEPDRAQAVALLKVGIFQFVTIFEASFMVPTTTSFSQLLVCLKLQFLH